MSVRLPYTPSMTVAAPSRRKTRRLEARIDEETANLLAEAAERAGVSLSQFVVETARERAEEVLACSDITVFSRSRFYEMVEALKGEPQIVPGLAKTTAEPKIYTRV